MFCFISGNNIDETIEQKYIKNKDNNGGVSRGVLLLLLNNEKQ